MTLADLAQDQFIRRRERAREVVAAGKLPLPQAEAQLRPWLAIAIVCDARLPEIDELLRVVVVLCGRPDDALLRHQVADDISTPAQRLAALATATGAALKADLPDAADRTRGLLTLCRHFNVRLPAPPTQGWTERKEAA